MWRKGLIEYTNKLFRQYIPKKANFDDFNNKKIKQIQYRNLDNKIAFTG